MHTVQQFLIAIVDAPFGQCRIMIQYDTMQEFNVDSKKAECDQLNLAHAARKIVQKRNLKTICQCPLSSAQVTIWHSSQKICKVKIQIPFARLLKLNKYRCLKIGSIIITCAILEDTWVGFTVTGGHGKLWNLFVLAYPINVIASFSTCL